SSVASRHAPAAVDDAGAHTQRLSEAIQADGRVWMSSALIDDEVWLRPCFVNFRTTEEDVLDVVELAAEIAERPHRRGGGARRGRQRGRDRRTPRRELRDLPPD